ncbi:MAG: putative rane-associated protein [Bryobacterales bacterium]|nr:putative rane-associated protein [Bryobacterales bacterium]
MESLLSGLSQHGYSILFTIVFLESIGLPVPAALALLVAGGASARGSLYLSLVTVSALLALILGDTLMFLMGRYTGWWLLSLLCRVSLNPESCILRSAESFYRRGRTVLVFAKFVPGINSMAAPLAGSMNMRFGQFLVLDLAGAALYAVAYLSVGFLFSDVLGTVTKNYQMVSRIVSWGLAVLVVGYLGMKAWIWSKARRLPSIPFVSPTDAAQALSSDAAVIYDVRSHGYYDRKATRVRGSTRLEPNALHHLENNIPDSKHVYLYCTCANDATSVRVAQQLLLKGARTAVIKGGLRAWKKAGLPLEPVPAEEITELPVFN